jgi:hypothetical protein
VHISGGLSAHSAYSSTLALYYMMLHQHSESHEQISKCVELDSKWKDAINLQRTAQRHCGRAQTQATSSMRDDNRRFSECTRTCITYNVQVVSVLLLRLLVVLLKQVISFDTPEDVLVCVLK